MELNLFINSSILWTFVVTYIYLCLKIKFNNNNNSDIVIDYCYSRPLRAVRNRPTRNTAQRSHENDEIYILNLRHTMMFNVHKVTFRYIRILPNLTIQQSTGIYLST